MDEAGETPGVMAVSEARALADEKGVDLVEISPNAKPPVCKIIDYGKMLYGLKKKEQQTKKATKVREMKGIRITFRIGPGDLERQRGQAEKFLTEGHAVRVQMRLRGRERAHTRLAIDKLNAFLKSLVEFGTVDQPPRAAGFQIIAILKPSKSSKPPKS